MKTTMKKQQAKVRRKTTPTYQILVAAIMAIYIPQAYGEASFNGVIEENFSGTATNNKWLMPLPGDGIKNPWDPSSPSFTVVNSACLTAGTGSAKPTATTAGSPPGCDGMKKDDPGKGVLRLTPAQNQTVGRRFILSSVGALYLHLYKTTGLTYGLPHLDSVEQAIMLRLIADLPLYAALANSLLTLHICLQVKVL